mgnify:CR=1 FL=1
MLAVTCTSQSADDPLSGLTLDLGFAWMTLPDDEVVDREGDAGGAALERPLLERAIGVVAPELLVVGKLPQLVHEEARARFPVIGNAVEIFRKAIDQAAALLLSDQRANANVRGIARGHENCRIIAEYAQDVDLNGVFTNDAASLGFDSAYALSGISYFLTDL